MPQWALLVQSVSEWTATATYLINKGLFIEIMKYLTSSIDKIKKVKVSPSKRSQLHVNRLKGYMF